jgi:uncharacterized protein YegP (UPF0339 family)
MTTRGPTFEVKKNVDGKWFWHERSSNGKIVDVAQAYSKKSNAVRAAKRKMSRTEGAKFKACD